MQRGCLIALVTAVALSAISAPAIACTRALYVAKDGTVLTGRSMDWGEDLLSNTWALPRGMKRKGMRSKDTVAWESNYGSSAADKFVEAKLFDFAKRAEKTGGWQ